MSVLPVGIAASGDEAYTLDNSLRFRSSASAYLSRTFTTPTNQNRWTLSCWVKRGSLGSIQAIIGQDYVSTSEGFVRFKGVRVLGDRIELADAHELEAVVLSTGLESRISKLTGGDMGGGGSTAR